MNFYIPSRDDFKKILTEVLQENTHLFRGDPPPSPDGKKLLTREETAERLKITLPTLRKYTKEGKIKSFKLGARVLYRMEDIESAIRERKYRIQ